MKFSKYLGVDLVGNKQLTLNPKYNARILISGFWKGLFTGQGIKDFINKDLCDYVKARECVNGTDHEYDIAGYAWGMHQEWGKQTRKCDYK